MLNELKILYHQGKQYIPDVRNVDVPGIFRGRPVISDLKVDNEKLLSCCPTNAISTDPISIDLGKCVFCGECSRLFPEKIKFTKDYKIFSNTREGLIVKEGQNEIERINKEKRRAIIPKLFSKSIKLRQVSAAGDNSCELELNATGNVNFDIGRFGVDFVASPRHADGIVITGPISKNMAKALELTLEATPSPKVIILVGTDAISGGIFADSPALDRSFLNKYNVDLYVAGNPVHPLCFVNAVIELIDSKIK